MRRTAVPGALALVALAAGCSSSSNGIAPAPGHACPANVRLEALVAPAPGTTGVPVDIGALYVSGASDGTYSLVDAGGTVAAGPAKTAPSPIRSAVLYGSLAVPVPTLSPRTTYTVHYQAAPVAAGACTDEYTTDIGSFITN